jgi:hypothetical protein
MHRSLVKASTVSAALGAALLLAGRPAQAKELGKLMPPDQSFELLLDTVPDAASGKDVGVELNKAFAMTIRIRPLTDAAKALKFTDLKVDARMPGHKHGMVTKPKVTETAPNEYRVDGLKLHMAGDWEFYLGLKAGDLPVFWTMPHALK